MDRPCVARQPPSSTLSLLCPIPGHDNAGLAIAKVRTMLCYYCMEDGHDVHAVALCRWCGGATCWRHVLEVHSVAEPTALLGSPMPPRRELVCQRCWEERIGSVSPKTTPRQRERETTLPVAADAVQLAEAILRGESIHLQRPLWYRFQRVRSLLAEIPRHLRFIAQPKA